MVNNNLKKWKGNFICKNCNKEFLIKKTRYGDKPKYCSRICWFKANKKGPRTSLELNCDFCGNKFLQCLSQKKRNKHNFCSKKCSQLFTKGRKNPNLGISNKGRIPFNKNKGKGFLDAKGYKWFMVDGKKILEHHLVYCASKNLDIIPKGFVIHHINGIKNDNRIENLMLMDRGEHTSLHSKIRFLKGSLFGKNKYKEKLK